ncbi:hypothetical protein MTsPCn9_16100 [Croceitalea sp. MTPC9]|uniref:hypothetical protein n=1 Tax=unclassified Croceitalea TaxID=2632280 RepID=UPI002B3A5FD3|nr:hypothetical protein MTsPCn6_08950 [Croceitalea sp. MTPC6]GMN16674.1 hypothetical protein MTsPCn9_16100 [Croceitalea sp. MTPC9]
MKTSDKLLPTRILIWSLIIGCMVVGYTVYTQYSSEISQEVTDAIVGALPDLDNAVAKL